MGKENIADFTLRRLCLQDVKKATKLSDYESWNQTASDWTFLIEDSGNLCLGTFDDDRLIGTVTAINYDVVSWIGMMLVDKNYRGRGVGKTLLSKIITNLGANQSIKLDATPVGQKIYHKFGFREEYEVYRMTGTDVSLKTLNLSQNHYIRPVLYNDMPHIYAYDKAVFGAPRKRLMEFLFLNNSKNSFLFEREGKIEGFVLGRRGLNYHHIGPLMASTPEIAKALLLKVLHELQSLPILLDIIADKREMIDWLKNIGFGKKRHFIRMYQNENRVSGRPKMQYVISGPEYG